MELFYGIALGSAVTYALTHIKGIKADIAAVETRVESVVAELKAELGKLTGGKL